MLWNAGMPSHLTHARSVGASFSASRFNDTWIPDDLGGGCMPDPRFAAPMPTLIGREAEMRLVEGLLEGSDPDSSALVLTGDPGVGKTAILRAAAAAGSAQGFRILMVQGVEFEAELSYAALHQLVLGIE